MKKLGTLLILTGLLLGGCRAWNVSPEGERGGSEQAMPVKKPLPRPIDELPTGTSDRAREIERSLGLGR